jgi:hypothetical protein
VTHPWPFLILLLKCRQEYPYRLRNRPILWSYLSECTNQRTYMYVQLADFLDVNGRFLSGGIILGSPLSCTDLFLYTITLPTVSCDAPPTLSYTTLELASRVLLSSKKPAFILYCTQQVYSRVPKNAAMISTAWIQFSTLNVYTGQNPRRHVVFIEIYPIAYINYLYQMAGVILTFFGAVYFCGF